MPYLLRRVRPRLALELGEELVRHIFVDNPGRALAVEWSRP
jgi:phosphotriesterase-related protein